ncbi:hypothetical protein Droror1_Dr00013780 [Drosera rotundifolia]
MFSREVMDLQLGLFFLLILVAYSVCDARDLPSSNLSGDADTGDKIDVCAFCEEYTSMALDYLAKNKTQKEVILLLNLACSELHPFQKQCVTLVDYYAPLFFSHLSREDADDFCKKVDLCGKHKLSTLLVKEDKCDLCHYVVDEVKIKLKDPDAKLEIIELLLKACDAVENYLKKCKTLVFEYGPLILTNAEKFLENTDICNTLHACSSTIAETASEDLPTDEILMVTSSS